MVMENGHREGWWQIHSGTWYSLSFSSLSDRLFANSKPTLTPLSPSPSRLGGKLLCANHMGPGEVHGKERCLHQFSVGVLSPLAMTSKTTNDTDSMTNRSNFTTDGGVAEKWKTNTLKSTD